MQKGDEAWFVMYHGFDFANFHVTDDYRIVVVNAHEIGFVDRDAAGEGILALCTCHIII